MPGLLLTHSYSLEFDPKQQRIGQPWAPLGTLYAAAVLQNAGMDVSFYDPTFSGSTNELLPLLEKKKPSVFIIYDDGFNYLSKMCLSNMREAAFRMIGLAKAHGSEVVVCSSDATDNYSMYLEKGAGFVILGEGEITLKELAVRLLNVNSDDFDDIRGISWKKDGKVQVNEPRELITEPDDLPFPAWDLIDIGRYRKMWKKKNGFFTMNMVTTRGCPYHCIWCAKPVYGNHYTSRSPQNVVAEMDFLAKNFSPDHIWFADDIFGLKPAWIDEFAALINARGTKIPFTIQSRVDLLLERNQVKPLTEAGCKKIWLGVESGSQKILDSMQKEITVGQMYAVSPIIRQAGIEQAFFLQLGFPGETKDDIKKTIRLLKDLMPDDIGISVTYPLPGTRFYDAVKSRLQSKTNWKDSDDIDQLIVTNFSKGFYKPLHRFIHKYFRYKQAVFYLASGLTGRSKITPSRLRRIILMPYYFMFSLFYKLILIHKDNAAREFV